MSACSPLQSSPDAATVRAAVERVLALPEFQPEKHPVRDWFGRLIDGVVDWIREFFGVSAETAGGIVAWTIYVALAIFAALIVVWLVRAALRALRRERPDADAAGALADVRAVQVADLERRAREAEARGDHALALRLYFWALVVGLGERGGLEYRGAWTNRELLDRGTPSPAVDRVLRPLVPELDRKVFSGAGAEAGDVARLSALCREMLGEQAMSARRIDKAIGLAVLVLAVVLALIPLFMSSPPDGAAGSVASNDERGRRALFLLVQELGFTPEAWSQPPGRLPSGEHVAWLASAPRTWAERQPVKKKRLGQDEPAAEPEPSPDEGEAPDPSAPEPSPEGSDPSREPGAGDTPPDAGVAQLDATPAALETQALTHYRRFVEEGGTLVVRFDERARRFLCEELELDAFRDVRLDVESPAGGRIVRTESGEELDADWTKGSTFRALAPNGPARVLWTASRSEDVDDEVPAVVVPVGNGRIIALGDDAFLDNAKLGEKDHALLAVRIAEHLPSGGRLLFDEFALGLWRPATATSLAVSPQLFLIPAHLALLVFLFVWAKAWAGTFPRDPEPLARVSPLARARARASLCVRAGRFDLLAGMLRRGSARRWLKIARLRASRAEPRTAEPVAVERGARDRAASDREPGSSAAIETEVERIAARIGKPDRARSWCELAAQHRTVRNADELDALARDLDRVEMEIGTEIGEVRRGSATHAG